MSQHLDQLSLNIKLEDSISLDKFIVCESNKHSLQFIENSFSKVKKLKNLILTKKSKCEIQVDGGVNMKNAKELVKNGAEILVAGNYIFKSNNPHEKINLLKKI